MDDYRAFLSRKMPRAAAFGIECNADALPPSLFDYQRHCVEFAMRQGRAAIACAAFAAGVVFTLLCAWAAGRMSDHMGG